VGDSREQALTLRKSTGGVDPSALNRLRLIDWSFPQAGPERGLHAIHPYPAKFIPQIPRELIRILHPGDGSAVFDPFCGSGTTLVEAAAAGHPALGVDLNPVATLIARVKTRPPATALAPIAASIVARARHAKPSVPPIPRVDHWFAPDVQRALAALVEAIGLVGDVAVSEALRACLSSIVVRVSNQDGDTRYAAVSSSSC
jgi:site-specific DNA-methyltransferase (cytosine-N4-specific)